MRLCRENVLDFFIENMSLWMCIAGSREDGSVSEYDDVVRK
jgi:hypothetical protein